MYKTAASGCQQEEPSIMNPQSSDELISAYFDGEVSPEERAAVERLLSESDDAQRELNETSRLSALLHSFPRESAPADLAGNVLQQTSQLEIPRVAPVRLSRNAWRELRAALISAVSTAAVLIVIWNIFDVPNEARHPLAQVDRAKEAVNVPFGAPPSLGIPTSDAGPAPASAPLLAETLHNQQRFEMAKVDSMASGPGAANSGRDTKAASAVEPPVAVQVDQTQTIASTLPEQKPGATRKMAAVPAMPAVAAKPPGAPLEAAAAMTVADAPIGDIEELDSEVKLSNDRFLEGLQAGKVLKYVPQPADPASNVAVVDLQVVNIEDGLEEIQKMLQKHSIRQIKDSANQDGRAKQDSKEAMEAELNELVFIYAFAPGERLAHALQDVNLHPDLFPKWSSSQPLQIAANAGPAGKKAAEEKRTQEKGKQGDPVNADAIESSTKSESELAESQLAVQALALRNSYQNIQSNPLTNSTVTNSSKSSPMAARAFGGVAKDSQIPNGQLPIPENRSLNIGNGVAMARRGNPTAGKPEEGYEVIRIPTVEMNASANEYFNRSVLNSNADRVLNDKALANNDPASRPASGGAMAPRPREAENANGSVKVLFVLHPMQTEADSAPAPANNRDKQ